MLSGRLFWLLRRDLKRGWSAAYHDYKTKSRIAEWSWPFWKQTPQNVPVHVLTGKEDWELCAWMLASWFHFTEETWRIFIHDDGTLPEAARGLFKNLFPIARVISRDEADARMDKALSALPFCHDYRNKHALALKIFDMAAFTDAERFIVLDSDVLFFNHPPEIMQWAMNPAMECWFNEDVVERCLMTPDHARTDLGVKLWRKVNTGLGLMVRAAIDLEFCERALGETSILKGDIARVEQTLFALCASKYGKGGLLPPTYEVTLNKEASEDAISRHYVGAVRDRFYGEGMDRLRDILLAKVEA